MPPGATRHRTAPGRDLVLFDRGADGVMDHIGIVSGVRPDGSSTTVEGNSGDRGLGPLLRGRAVRHARGMLTFPGMSAIQVKNVPPALHEALRRRATAEGMPLADYVLQLIERDLALPSQSEWLAEMRAQPASAAPFDPAGEIRRIRDERDEDLLRRVTDRR